jgi:hypothetical protein
MLIVRAAGGLVNTLTVATGNNAILSRLRTRARVAAWQGSSLPIEGQGVSPMAGREVTTQAVDPRGYPKLRGRIDTSKTGAI